VEFLKLVLGLDRVKIEKIKIKRVLEWPKPKSIKDIQKFLNLANYY